jgi:hypothetical protein
MSQEFLSLDSSATAGAGKVQSDELYRRRRQRRRRPRRRHRLARAGQMAAPPPQTAALGRGLRAARRKQTSRASRLIEISPRAPDPFHYLYLAGPPDRRRQSGRKWAEGERLSRRRLQSRARQSAPGRAEQIGRVLRQAGPCSLRARHLGGSSRSNCSLRRRSHGAARRWRPGRVVVPKGHEGGGAGDTPAEAPAPPAGQIGPPRTVPAILTRYARAAGRARWRSTLALPAIIFISFD